LQFINKNFCLTNILPKNRRIIYQITSPYKHSFTEKQPTFQKFLKKGGVVAQLAVREFCKQNIVRLSQATG